MGKELHMNNALGGRSLPLNSGFLSQVHEEYRGHISVSNKLQFLVLSYYLSGHFLGTCSRVIGWWPVCGHRDGARVRPRVTGSGSHFRAEVGAGGVSVVRSGSVIPELALFLDGIPYGCFEGVLFVGDDKCRVGKYLGENLMSFTVHSVFLLSLLSLLSLPSLPFLTSLIQPLQ
jgi:hypothetical protein